MQTNNLSKSLIKAIQAREISINTIKIELIKQWIAQGKDLLKLQEQQQCSQNELTKLTEISRGAVYNYIHISKDKRLSEKLQGAHRGGQLENFNQKELLKLTKLDDDAFEAAVNTGTIVSADKEKEAVAKKSEAEIDNTSRESEIIDATVLEEPSALKEEDDNSVPLSILTDIITTPYEMGEKTNRPNIGVDVDDASVDRAHRLMKTTGITKNRIVAQALVLMETILELDAYNLNSKQDGN